MQGKFQALSMFTRVTLFLYNLQEKEEIYMNCITIKPQDPLSCYKHRTKTKFSCVRARARVMLHRLHKNRFQGIVS